MRALGLLAALLVFSTCSTPTTGQGASVSLTVQVFGEGSGVLQSAPLGIDCGQMCTVQFAPGTPIELSARPDPGSVVGTWEGCPMVRGSLCQITLDQDLRVRVRFDVDSGTPVEYVPLLIDRQGGGHVTADLAAPLACGVACRADVPKNSWVKLTAVADFGHYFAGWGGACQGAEPTCDVFMRGETQAIALFSPQVCVHRNFCWENPIPTGSRALGAYAVAEDDVWMSTLDQQGSLLRWNGIGWLAQADSQIVGSARPALTSFWASARNDVWGTDEQRLWHFDGAVYQVQPLPVAAKVRAVHGRRADDVWVVGDVGASFHFDGTTWTAQPTGVGATLYSVWVTPDGTAWAGGYSGTLLYWDGTAWKSVGSPLAGTVMRLSGSSASDVWAVVSNGMLHFDGVSWTEATTAPRLTDIQVLAADNIWGHNRAQVHHFDGTGWLAYSGPRIGHIAAGPRTVWVFEEATGQIFRMVGQQILPMYPSIRLPRQPTPQRLRDVWVSDPENAWAVGEGGTLLHHDGKTWTKLNPFTAEDLLTIHGTARDDIWIGGSNSLFHYDGNGWSSRSGPPLVAGDSLCDLISEPGGKLWMHSCGRGVFRRGTDGAIKTDFPGSRVYDSFQIYGCLFSLGSGSPWLVRNEGLYRWNGSAWAQDPTVTERNLSCAGGVSPTNLWFASYSSSNWFHYNGSRIDQSLWTSLYDGATRRVIPIAADNIWNFGWEWDALGHYDGKSWNFEWLMGARVNGGSRSGDRLVLVGGFGNILRYRP